MSSAKEKGAKLVRLRIVNCDNPFCWYWDLVGEIFEASWFLPWGCYIVESRRGRHPDDKILDPADVSMVEIEPARKSGKCLETTKTRSKKMRMPKIYNKCENKTEPAPMPLLTIDSGMCIIAVDADGNDLATVVDPKDGATAAAKGAIEGGGHDASWAVWDDEGRFVRLAD